MKTSKKKRKKKKRKTRKNCKPTFFKSIKEYPTCTQFPAPPKVSCNSSRSFGRMKVKPPRDIVLRFSRAFTEPPTRS